MGVLSGQTAPRVLVTGAGGPAAVALIRGLTATGSAEVVAADIDPLAAGLFLVPAERRFLLPPGDDLGFAEAVAFLCTVAGVDVVIPTVDTELLPLARVRDDFARSGVRLLLAAEATLALCADKLRLVRHCAAAGIAVPATVDVNGSFEPAEWAGPPRVVKPRAGSGSRGVRLLRDPDELRRLPRYAGLMLQEYLPGAEYSIDVLSDGDGAVRAVVPRERLKTDSGVSVAGRTLHDEELERFGRQAAETIGLTWVANVQCRRDRDDQPRLLEINPRFPGTMPLTVAAGVDMPVLALRGLLTGNLGEMLGGGASGRPAEPGALPFDDVSHFHDVAMVRHWEDVVVALDAFDATPQVVGNPRAAAGSGGPNGASGSNGVSASPPGGTTGNDPGRSRVAGNGRAVERVRDGDGR
ncbi:MAG: ATP-grasp domain-containing protein [Frankia sp.]